MAGPLSGVRIIDFTANMSGPFGTMILGDQGADVIKVEPPRGDHLRNVGTMRGGLSTYFANLNRSKRSVVIDLQAAESKRVVEALLDTADVVVHNFRAGVAATVGLDADTVRRNRPGVVYAEIVGYGVTGPFAERPVYDHVIQAVSGMAAIQAENSESPPRFVRHGIVDKTTGLVLAQAVTAALLERARTGRGRAITVCMLDVAVSVLWPDGMMNHTALGEVELRDPVAKSFRLSETFDGYVSIMPNTAAHWYRLVTALELDHPEHLGPESDHREWLAVARDILRQMAKALRETPTDEVVTRLGAAGVPCAPIVALEDVPTHPQVSANELINSVDHPLIGPIRQPRPLPPADPAGRESDGSAVPGRPAPALGEHTGEVLAELGFTTNR